MVPNPIEPDFPNYAVQLTDISAQSLGVITSFTSSGWNKSDPIYAILDSGTTNSVLPADAVNAIYSYLGAATVISQGVLYGVVPCNLTTAETVFTFTFGGENGVRINVLINDLIMPREPSEANYTFTEGTPACVLGIQPSANYETILGDNFLRSTYAVFDLDNQRIALAQINLDSTAESNIQEIVAGADGIPGVQATLPVLPFDYAKLRALGAGNPFAGSPASAGPAPTGGVPQPSTSINPTTFQLLPGSVTANGPAGAMWTGSGVPLPTGRFGTPAMTGTNALPSPTGSGIPSVMPLRRRVPSQISPPIVSLGGAASERTTGLVTLVLAVFGVCALIMM